MRVRLDVHVDVTVDVQDDAIETLERAASQISLAANAMHIADIEIRNVWLHKQFTHTRLRRKER